MKVMKKIFFISLMSILMTAGIVNAGSVTPVHNINPGPAPAFSVWVKLIITFHRPKLDCKSGFGICLTIDYGFDKPSGTGGTGCTAEARINPANQLELRVTEYDLQNYEGGFALTYFKSGSITLEDPYTFPPDISKKLGSDKQLTLLAGTYPVIYDASAKSFTLTFPK